MSTRTKRPIDCLEDALLAYRNYKLTRAKIEGCYYVLVHTNFSDGMKQYAHVEAFVKQYFPWYLSNRRNRHHISVVIEHLSSTQPTSHIEPLCTWMYWIYDTNFT